MKKKVISYLIFVSIIFCIPISKIDSAVTLPITDLANDVVLIHGSTVITNVCQTSVDIAELNVDLPLNNITFTFYGTPIIDEDHVYNVTVLWEQTGVNRTECFAGYNGSLLYYGVSTILVNSLGDVVYFDEDIDSAYIFGNSVVFPFNTPPPIPALGRSMSSAFNAGGIASVPAEETDDGVTASPSESYAYVDGCGMFLAWIPLPDEGGIELPIILSLLGTSFIIILVIRRRKK